VRDGRIEYVGTNAAAKTLAGPATKIVDLQGRMVMPGLVDGHMHPLSGGLTLTQCNLNYERLTVPQFQARVQACLDQSKNKEPDQWLQVVNWFQQDMLPAGVAVSHETLDTLNTKRPVAVRSSFGHSVLANKRALQLAHIDARTPDPVGGKIQHAANGEPSGILEDAAFGAIVKLIPPPTPEEDVAAARAAQDALRKQGVTTFLDAAAAPADIESFTKVQQSGDLTVRAHFAVPIRPTANLDPAKAVAAVKATATHFDQGPLRPAPTITVRNAKLFLDGVITAPAFTGAMLEPYFSNQGTQAQPHWAPSKDRSAYARRRRSGRA
jgi:predicted amidohydrolase YtcJ